MIYSKNQLKRMSKVNFEKVYLKFFPNDTIAGLIKSKGIERILINQANAAPTERNGDSREIRIRKMNGLARRIWDGQSLGLKVKVRAARVVAGLIKQGYEDIISELKEIS